MTAITGKSPTIFTVRRFCEANNIERVVVVYGSSISSSAELSNKYVSPNLFSTMVEILVRPGTLLVNGGYMGTMASLARLVTEKGGLALGIRTASITDALINDGFSEILYATDHWDRLAALVEVADAYFVLPGGIGTLTEIASTLWAIDRCFTAVAPTIFLGSFWESILFEFLHSSMAFRNSLSNPIVFATKSEDILRAFSLSGGRRK